MLEVGDCYCDFCPRVAEGGVSGRVLRVCHRADPVSGAQDVASQPGWSVRCRERVAWDGESVCGACQLWCCWLVLCAY